MNHTVKIALALLIALLTMLPPAALCQPSEEPPAGFRAVDVQSRFIDSVACSDSELRVTLRFSGSFTILGMDITQLLENVTAIEITLTGGQVCAIPMSTTLSRNEDTTELTAVTGLGALDEFDSIYRAGIGIEKVSLIRTGVSFSLGSERLNELLGSIFGAPVDFLSEVGSVAGQVKRAID